MCHKVCFLSTEAALCVSIGRRRVTEVCAQGHGVDLHLTPQSGHIHAMHGSVEVKQNNTSKYYSISTNGFFFYLLNSIDNNGYIKLY